MVERDIVLLAHPPIHSEVAQIPLETVNHGSEEFRENTHQLICVRRDETFPVKKHFFCGRPFFLSDV
jgi:hypothetical protein